MGWGKRIVLFLAVNILVMLTVSFLLNLFGVQPYLTSKGLNIQALMTFCLIWGMGGAFISLALSKIMAKWLMGVKVIDPQTTSSTERRLLEMVYKLARDAGIPNPEVGIYESPEVNAFATGPTRSRSLIAVSRGLLQRMGANEIEGVLGHEVTHIANGDMVTMTLLQGVINAFVMFLARVLAYVILRSGKREDSSSPSPFAYMMLVFGLEIVFMILGSTVIAWFSRYREFRADAGGARLAGKQKMIAALEALQAIHGPAEAQAAAQQQPAFQAMKISSSSKFLHLFASHPPLEARIARLKEGGSP